MKRHIPLTIITIFSLVVADISPLADISALRSISTGNSEPTHLSLQHSLVKKLKDTAITPGSLYGSLLQWEPRAEMTPVKLQWHRNFGLFDYKNFYAIPEG